MISYAANGNPASLYAIHFDHLGTSQVITDQYQQVVWQAQDTPFGQATLIKAGITNPLRFAGQYYDAETQLHYNWNRYYDPALGRYITSDPIGLAGGLNTFGYVGQSPLANIDPDGLETMVISNINGGYFLGIGGQHTGMIVLRGGGDQENSFLYDPSGSYEIYDKEYGVRIPLGSGRLIQGDESTPIDLDDY